eukprot:TRINITY_DN19342_c0_g2_i1.p1 TRINITY_DN19342_c0_g2~~TRINITY_DN19342_c0_g2_i1.p1  ORF type:complete len:334 (+),score=79.98 TRINITY_DN19342_c0_g2_i1:75-1004(+)
MEDLKTRSHLRIGEWRGNSAFEDDWLVCWKRVRLGAEEKNSKTKKEEVSGMAVEVVYVVMKSCEEYSGKFRLEKGRLVDRYQRRALGSEGAERESTTSAEETGIVRLDIWDFPAVTSFYVLHKNEAYKGLRVRVSLHIPLADIKREIWLHQHLQEHLHEVPSYLLVQYVKEGHDAVAKVKKGKALEALQKVHSGYLGRFESEKAKVESLVKRVKEREAARLAEQKQSVSTQAAQQTTTPGPAGASMLPSDDGPAYALTPPDLTASLLLDDILSQPSVCPTPSPPPAAAPERVQPPIPFTPTWEIFPTQP